MILGYDSFPQRSAEGNPRNHEISQRNNQTVARHVHLHRQLADERQVERPERSHAGFCVHRHHVPAALGDFWHFRDERPRADAVRRQRRPVLLRCRGHDSLHVGAFLHF